ncbi:MAG: ABC transporter substrate-binding protein [Myxococcota bacterium]
MTVVRIFPALLAALAACTGTSPSEDAATDGTDPAASTRDALVIGIQADAGMLMPAVYESATDGAILETLSYPLVDTEFDCSLKKMPALAKSWEWSDDGKVLSMDLRDDIQWEDGEPVTAEDIKFTYDLIADPAVASPRVASIQYLEPDGRPKIVDATHIEWHFTQAYDRDTQIAHVNLGIVPKHVWENVDRSTIRGNDKTKQPLSYGPWRLAKWDQGASLVLEPNPKFTGPEFFRAHLNRVIFRVLPEYSTRLIELEGGNIDLMEAVLVADADRLREEHPEIKLTRRGWRSNDYIGWNLNNPLFEDLRVRKAMALATDIDGMIGKLLTSKTGESYAKRSIGTITPALCGVHNDDVKPLPFAVDQAKALLAEAGWKDSDSDGVLDKGGQKLAFSLLTNTGNKRRGDAAILFQDQMKQIGIQVEIQRAESNQFFERLRKKDYEAALAGWAAGLFVDPSTIWHCDQPEKGKKYEFNFTGYCNPEVDALIEKGLATPNPKDAAPIWKEMQAKIYEDQPYLFLWWMDEIVAINDRFQNTSIDVLSPYNRLQEWEVPADKVKYQR